MEAAGVECVCPDEDVVSAGPQTTQSRPGLLQIPTPKDVFEKWSSGWARLHEAAGAVVAPFVPSVDPLRVNLNYDHPKKEVQHVAYMPGYAPGYQPGYPQGYPPQTMQTSPQTTKSSPSGHSSLAPQVTKSENRPGLIQLPHPAEILEKWTAAWARLHEAAGALVAPFIPDVDPPRVDLNWDHPKTEVNEVTYYQPGQLVMYPPAQYGPYSTMGGQQPADYTQQVAGPAPTKSAPGRSSLTPQMTKSENRPGLIQLPHPAEILEKWTGAWARLHEAAGALVAPFIPDVEPPRVDLNWDHPKTELNEVTYYQPGQPVMHPPGQLGPILPGQHYAGPAPTRSAPGPSSLTPKTTESRPGLVQIPTPAEAFEDLGKAWRSLNEAVISVIVPFVPSVEPPRADLNYDHPKRNGPPPPYQYPTNQYIIPPGAAAPRATRAAAPTASSAGECICT